MKLIHCLLLFAMSLSSSATEPEPDITQEGMGKTIKGILVYVDKEYIDKSLLLGCGYFGATVGHTLNIKLLEGLAMTTKYTDYEQRWDDDLGKALGWCVGLRCGSTLVEIRHALTDDLLSLGLFCAESGVHAGIKYAKEKAKSLNLNISAKIFDWTMYFMKYSQKTD